MHRNSIVLALFALALILGGGLFFPASAASEGPAAGWGSYSFNTGGGHIVLSSPVLADIDGDGQQEIITGTTARRWTASGYAHDAPMKLVVMNADGSVKWTREPGAPMQSSPSVGDIDGDGDVEIVVGIGGDVEELNHEGGVVAYDHRGNKLWHFRTQDHPPFVDGLGDGVISTPALCDVEGDGDMEIAFGSWDQRIYLIDHNANSLWNNVPNGFPGPGYYNADTIWSSAACADLNSDGQQEIVIGADITGGGVLPDESRPSDGGYLYIFDKSGTVLVRRQLAEAIYASPAVGDLDGNGTLEIVLGTAYYWWEQHGMTDQPYVYAFDTSQVFSSLRYANTAKLPDLPGWPRPTMYPGFSSPALADLDGNGDLEIVIGSGLPNGAAEPGTCRNRQEGCYGVVYAWHHDGRDVSGFPMWPKDVMDKNSFVRSSPSVADIDNDGNLEILAAMLWDVAVIGHDGRQEGNLHTTWTVVGSPAVGDTNGDGFMEVWIGGGNYDDQSRGYMWLFERGEQGVGAQPWPMFRQNAQRTGLYPAPARFELNVRSAHIIHDVKDGTQATLQLQLQNVGGNAGNWAASTTDNRVAIQPGSGTLAGGSETMLTVQVNTRDLRLGTHNLGEIVITTSVVGRSTASIPIEVPVTVLLGEFSQVFMPLVGR